MPGTFGGNQVGMSDFVPSPTDDVLLWLCAIALPPGTEPATLRLESLADGRPGSDVVVAAVTLFRGTGDPLVRSPRFSVRVNGFDGRPPQVDLGTIIRTLPAATAPGANGAGDVGTIFGWGTPRVAPGAPTVGSSVVDLSLAPDAVVGFGDWDVPGRDLLAGNVPRDPAGLRSIEVLPAPTRAGGGRHRGPDDRRARCPAGSASRRRTAGTCRRSATATRSTRRSSRTPAAT